MPGLPVRHLDEGFTLVETLIVVAIIALLLAMIVPYYGGAHARGLLVKCQSNLRCVGVGVQSYMQTHEALPVSEHLANPHPELLSEMLGSYVPAEAFYCPAEMRSDLRHSKQNVEAGNISYYYYCCRTATPDHEASQFLWRAGATNAKWPRLITNVGVMGISGWETDPWVMSDRWVSGELPHPFGQKGLNFLLLGGQVKMSSGSPRDEFR
jgi:prepilin-type N-terminal cleavage/methylation domain-containing protein